MLIFNDIHINMEISTQHPCRKRPLFCHPRSTLWRQTVSALIRQVQTSHLERRVKELQEQLTQAVSLGMKGYERELHQRNIVMDEMDCALRVYGIL